MKQIELSKKGSKYKGLYFALVDDEDFEYINKYNWSIHYISKSATLYASRKDSKTKKTIWMHRFIYEKYNSTIYKEIDHKDRNGLNNQKCNLRQSTRTQNCCNTKPFGKVMYRGIDINGGKYRVRIKTEGKSIYLGRFNDIETAVITYNNAAKMYFGEFALQY